MKTLIASIALATITSTASASVCNVNPNQIVDYPGYHGQQKVWYDKGDYLLMFSAVRFLEPISYKQHSNVESIVTHYRLYKEDCRNTEIEVVITENKEPVFVEPVIIVPVVPVAPIDSVTYTTTTQTLYKRERKEDYGPNSKKHSLIVKKRAYTVTTVTGSDGSIVTTETQVGNTMATRFYTNGKKTTWEQVQGSNQFVNKVKNQSHTWNRVLNKNTSNLVTNGYVAYQPKPQAK